mmetsp:Transcript_19235/g.53615  ORF Transcript_19235/g.53615 Transcript_19235/m.53615 type:complete len:124 (+) Transcript_19235:625-996(+)
MPMRWNRGNNRPDTVPNENENANENENENANLCSSRRDALPIGVLTAVALRCVASHTLVPTTCYSLSRLRRRSGHWKQHTWTGKHTTPRHACMHAWVRACPAIVWWLLLVLFSDGRNGGWNSV